jgi:carboxyl-terminal processing protease
VRFVVPALIGVVCTVTLALAQSPSTALYQEVTQILAQHYVDPLGIGADRLQQRLGEITKQCAPCSLNAAETQLSKWFEQIGDFHLRLRPGLQDDAAAPKVIGAASTTTRYGFDAIHNASNLITVWAHPEFPAAQAGLRRGDVILSVDGKRETPQLLYRSIAKSEFATRRIKLGVRRSDGSTRELIFNPSTALLSSYATRVDKTTVITIPSMDGNLTDQVIFKLLQTAVGDGTERIVLDLRYHIGGNPFTAVRLASAFLGRVESTYIDKPGTLIKYNMNEAVKRYEISSAPEKNNTETIAGWVSWRGPVTILVGQRTESMGETFTSFFQRTKHGSVIGTGTAGGGGVLANSFRLEGGARLQVTTHFILDEGGQRLPSKVQPDIELPLDPDLLRMGRDSQLEHALR